MGFSFCFFYFIGQKTLRGSFLIYMLLGRHFFFFFPTFFHCNEEKKSSCSTAAPARRDPEKSCRTAWLWVVVRSTGERKGRVYLPAALPFWWGQKNACAGGTPTNMGVPGEQICGKALSVLLGHLLEWVPIWIACRTSSICAILCLIWKDILSLFCPVFIDLVNYLAGWPEQKKIVNWEILSLGYLLIFTLLN